MYRLIKFFLFRSYAIDCISKAFTRDRHHAIEIKNYKKLNLAKHVTLTWVAPVPGYHSYRVLGGDIPSHPSYLLHGEEEVPSQPHNWVLGC